MRIGRVVSLVVLAAMPAALLGQDQWPSYGRDPGQSHFSPLAQITPANVKTLQRAWTFRYGAGTSDLGDMGLDYRFEMTPLIIGGTMYISTPSAPRVPDLKSTVTALEPETGTVVWKYESPKNIHGRGLAYWPGANDINGRLFFGTDGGYLAAVDVKTGKLVESLGEAGYIDLFTGVASENVSPDWRARYTVPNPPAIYRDLVITGARPGEVGPPGPRGDVRAWDAKTGKLVWTFHTVPQPGEPNHETWSGDTWRDRTGVNNWSTMTVDAERGLVYVPLGSASPDRSALGRPGLNLYADSVVALDVKTGALKWFYQLTHHDQWDYDLPTPPTLVEVKKDGKVIPAVAQAGKQGYVFILDRMTGQPIFGAEERPTPRGDNTEDVPWPTQPFPLKPGPIARISITRDEIATITPEMTKWCQDFWDKNQVTNQGPYTRPLKDKGTINFPGSLGGANWGAPSFNPQTGLLFVNVMNRSNYQQPLAASSTAGGPGAGAPPATSAGAPGQARPPGGGPPGRGRGGFQYQLDEETFLPCWATPWGELVAVDVNKGEIAWRVPLGMTEALGEKGLKTGTANLGGSLATASGLVFIAATNDRRFRAFDARTGEELWITELDASGHASPITYMGKDGKQYVVTAAAGGTAIAARRMSDALVAFRLP